MLGTDLYRGDVHEKKNMRELGKSLWNRFRMQNDLDEADVKQNFIMQLFIDDLWS